MPNKSKGPVVFKQVYTASSRDQDQLALDIVKFAAEGHVVHEYDRVVKAEDMKFPVSVLVVRRRVDPTELP